MSLIAALGAAAGVSAQTFGPPAALKTSATVDSADDRRPQVATNGAGAWVAVWETTNALGGSTGSDRDLLVARSADAGVTWSPPAALNSNASSDSGDDSRPRVAAGAGGAWVAVWHSTDSLGGTIGGDADILVSRSTDGGITWTAPAALDVNAASDAGNDTRPHVSTDGVGTWLAVWESTDSLGASIGSDFDLLVSRSTDAGATWTVPTALNTNAASDS
ncbi:MAG: sialidase family protein, partial [Myxococcota bacterium]